MRIGYVCADRGVPVFGRKGCSVHVQEVVRALTAQGCRVEIFTARPEGKPSPGLETVRVVALPLPVGERAVREQAALAANADLHALLQLEGPFDLVYERYSLWSYAAMEYARSCRTPGLLEVNAPLIDEQAERRGLVDRPGAERVAQRVFSAASGLLAVSDEVAAYLARYSATTGRIHLVPNGVAPDRFGPSIQPAQSRESGCFTVGFVGTLKPWHGLEILVEAFARLVGRVPGARLLIVGDGPERERLELDVARRGLGDLTRLTGSVAPDHVPSWLASMDVAVAPYPPLEHFYFSPLKVYEYMAAGLPVVVSAVGQLKQLIRHDYTGLTYPAGDAEALVSVLVRLHENLPLRRRLGLAAREEVIQSHTWEGVARRILHLSGLDAAPMLCGRREVIS
jgi:glycosyltransferase involved in cell wall biosynthesis